MNWNRAPAPVWCGKGKNAVSEEARLAAESSVELSPELPAGDASVEPSAGQACKPPEAGTDSLLDCLLLIARNHGRASTPAAVLSGLPLAEGGVLTPQLFQRAAAGLGFSSKVVSLAPTRLNPALLPAVLLLKDSKACVVLALDPAARTASVLFPEFGDEVVETALETLEQSALERAIYVRPNAGAGRAGDTQVIGSIAGQGRAWLWQTLLGQRALYRDVLLAALLINLAAVAMPLFIMNVYDRVVPNHAFETLWVLSFGLMLVLVGEYALRLLRGRFVDLAGSRADLQVSAGLMARVLDLRMVARPSSAGSFAANLRAFDSVRDFISSATIVTMIDLPFGLLFVAIIAWVALPMALPFVVGVIVLLIHAWLLQRSMRTLALSSQQASAQRNSSLIEALVGLETLKVHGAQGRFQLVWEQSTALLAQIGNQLRLQAAAVSSGSSLIQHLVSVSMVIVGVQLIAANELTTGGLIACYILSSRAMGPFSQAAGLLLKYHRSAAALAGLDKVMSAEVEHPAGQQFTSRGRLQGEIEFRNVSFSYPGQRQPALRDVSLRIRPGEKVAVLGRIGSGKTTLEKLVLGLYIPDEGAVLVDGIDVRQLDPAELRRNIGYVQQDVNLFSGSLRDNIVLGHPFASDEAVVKAAELGGLLEFVNAHPSGFGMKVGERGDSLSGGQRQAVAIARALISDPAILLLDEPTASMDLASEEAAKKNLAAFAAERTMLVVTHRTSLLDLVERVIVVDKGRVVADGPKAQVIEALRQGRIGRAEG